MSILKKLFKWLLILALVIVIAVIIVVWPVLGVNPFEGRQAHLWDVVSNEVDFFIRFPGARVLKSDPATRLGPQPGWEWLDDAGVLIEDVVRETANGINPHLPLGLKIDIEKDLFDREMAIAGIWRNDFQAVRPDRFIIAMRMAWYGRFVSALRRGFVRDKIPDGDRVEVVSGLYLKVRLPPDAVEQLNQIRSSIPREEPDVIYVGRVRDVLLISDTPQWIEAPLRGRQETLPADPWFETEFMRNSDEGESIEIFMRPNLSVSLVDQHGDMDRGGPLAYVKKIVPRALTGDVTIQARPDEGGVKLALSNNPPTDGFSNVTKEFLINIFEREKIDLAGELSDDGIGKFIPAESVVAAVVLSAEADDVVGLLLSFMPDEERQLLDDMVRDNRYARGFEQLLRSEFASMLGDLHLIIVHRPPEMDRDNMATFYPPDDAIEPQVTITLVSRMKSGVKSGDVKNRITANLGYLGLKPQKAADTRGLAMAVPVEELDVLALLQPTYGAAPDGAPYIVFSSSKRGALSVLDAAGAEGERFVNQTGARTAIGNLPSDGASIAMLLNGETLRRTLADQVRVHAGIKLDFVAFEKRKFREYVKAGLSQDAAGDRTRADKDTYIATEYPRIREAYLAGLARWSSIDTIAFSAKLGIGATRQVRAAGYISLVDVSE